MKILDVKGESNDSMKELSLQLLNLFFHLCFSSWITQSWFHTHKYSFL